MKVLYMVVVLAVLLSASTVLAAPNPAAAYAEQLGYEYRLTQTPEGARGVITVRPGVEFDAWAFFKGKVGQEHSYGARFGYETQCVREQKGSHVEEYAVCVREFPGKQGTHGAEVVEERIKLLDLMTRNGEPLRETAPYRASAPPPRTTGDEAETEATLQDLRGADALPSSFDWRNYNGHAYIGPVRNQGNCGSCYSFGANAAAESTYNYAMGLYDGSCADFSESYIIWCLGRLSKYNSHFFGCDGADYDYYELEALTVEGVANESDFPYTESDPGSCTHWGDPTTVFESWHRISCSDIDAMKTAIMNYGALDVAVYVSSAWENYSGGIYDDTRTSCSATPCYYVTTDHAVSLVGWDDDPPEGGGGCWILRNSWGPSWGESGYMRCRYDAARVACAATYLVYEGSGGATVTANDDSYSVMENGTLSVAAPGVLSNDVSSGSLSASLVTDVSHGDLSLSSNGSFTYEPDSDWYGADSFIYEASDGTTSDTATVSLSVIENIPVPTSLTQRFEAAFVNGAPPGWTRTFQSGDENWVRNNGDEYGTPAHGGTYNAMLFDNDYAYPETYLVTPMLDLGTNATIEFWHMQRSWYGDQDELRVYYRTSEGGVWNLLATYTSHTASWTKRTLNVANPGSTCTIGFLGKACYGYGVCIDDVIITGAHPAANVPPSVAVSGPSHNSHCCEGTNITITADANDGDGSVTRVEFFRSPGGKVGEDTGAPYACAWLNVPVGSFDLTAVAHDDDDASTTSTVVTLIVDADYDRDGLPNQTDTDDDNDGMPDDWENDHDLNPTNAADAAQDDDFDGLSNLDEFVVGSGPNNPDEVFETTTVAVPSNNFECVISWQSETGRLYTVERSTDCMQPNWAPVSGLIDMPGTGGTMSFTNLGPSAGTEYFKVRVRMDN